MRSFFMILICILLLNSVWASKPKRLPSTGTFSGTVQDKESGKPVEDAVVELIAGSSVYWGKTNSNGAFNIGGIPPGTYNVTVQRVGYKTVTVRSIQIASGQVASISFQMAVEVYQVTGVKVIEITEKKLPSETSYSRGQSFIQDRIAGGNTWQGVLETVPGIQLNAFGQVHTRGEHQLVSFSMDGIQLPVEPESEIGYLVYPGFLNGVEVKTGSYDPSLAGETGVVAELNPIQAKGLSEGALTIFGGDHEQYGFDGYWAGRSQDNAWNYFSGVQSAHTDLRLEPPNPDQQTLNNSGTDSSVFFHVNETSTTDGLNLAFGREISAFGIPNTPISQAAGVVQNEEDANTFALISWEHFFSDDIRMNLGAAWLASAQSVVNNGVYTPFMVANPITMPNASAAGLPANPEDPGSPYLPVIYRDNSQLLLNLSATMAVSKEELVDAGSKADFINTRNFYDITDAGGVGTLPSARVQNSGNYPAFNGILFAAAHLHPNGSWHIDFGANLDRFDDGEGLSAQQLSPFLNAAYSFSQAQAIRFSYNHEFNIPPIVPDIAGDLSGLPENVNAYELSYELQKPAWVFRFGPYLKNFSDQIDGSLLLPYSNLPIFYPVNFTTSRDYGLEISASTNFKTGFNGFLSYSLSFAQSTSPGASETSLDNPLYLDHDQRNTLDFGLSYNFGKGFYVSEDSEYGSGFPQGAAAIYNLDGVYPFGISGRVPSFVTNLNMGWRDNRSPVQAWLEVFNLFNDRPSITYLSDFTGTRFVKERSMVVNFSARL